MDSASRPGRVKVRDYAHLLESISIALNHWCTDSGMWLLPDAPRFSQFLDGLVGRQAHQLEIAAGDLFPVRTDLRCPQQA